jgi:predicted nucleic acid-binding protein
MAPVFVDTGGWIAMAVSRDQYHKQAASYYQELSRPKFRVQKTHFLI